MSWKTLFFWDDKHEIPSPLVILTTLGLVTAMMCYGMAGPSCSNKPETAAARYFPLTRLAFELMCVRWPQEKK